VVWLNLREPVRLVEVEDEVIELGGAEVGGTDELVGTEDEAGVELTVELTGEDAGGGTTAPPSHNTWASSSATWVCE